MKAKIRKAILPAAGLGTRFLPATKASPKGMLPIVDKPLIQYAVEEALAAGIEDYIIITGKAKRAIEDHFDSAYRLEETLRSSGKDKLLTEINRLNYLNIAYIRQRAPLGLGHAILCAKAYVGREAFIVILSDDVIDPDYPLLRKMMAVYAKTGAPVIAFDEVPTNEVHRYGILDGRFEKGLFRITDLVEKPKPDKAPSNYAIIGRYILTPEIFGILEKQQPGAGGEIQLTDALKELLRKMPLYGYRIGGKRYDAGDKLGYLKVTVDFALRNKELAPGFKAYLTERLKSK
jgi:UTP--glucose-1-phosphate uridylyltransferase